MTRLLPPPVGYWLADRAADLAYHAIPHYRQAVQANIAQVLARSPDDAVVIAAARRCFSVGARNFWDLGSLPHTTPTALCDRIVFDPLAIERITGLRAQGRGLVAITAHLGAFDIAGQLLAIKASPMMVLTAQTTRSWLFELVTCLRASWGATIEPATTGALRRIIGHLRQGGTVGIVADHDLAHHGPTISFCGRPTRLPIGAIRIALETGAPMIALFCPRHGDGYRFVIEEVPLQRDGHGPEAVNANLPIVAALLERYIRLWPDQWVTFRPIWPIEAPA